MTSLLIKRFFSIRRRAISIYLKEKGGATDTGNYWDLKLTDHCMKVIKRVLERVLHDTVEIHVCRMHFKYIPGRGTTDAIFIM